MMKNRVQKKNKTFLLSAIGLYFLAINLLFLSFCPLPPVCYAQAVPSAELINNAKSYNGKIVVFAGEVIGDVMQRGEFAWINIKDGNDVIGAWVGKDLIKDILYTGNYKTKGDWVEVVGIFSRACLEHGGDLDIHAHTLRKINSGRAVRERLNLDKRNLSLIFLGVLCLVLILRQLSRK